LSCETCCVRAVRCIGTALAFGAAAIPSGYSVTPTVPACPSARVLLTHKRHCIDCGFHPAVMQPPQMRRGPPVEKAHQCDAVRYKNYWACRSPFRKMLTPHTQRLTTTNDQAISAIHRRAILVVLAMPIPRQSGAGLPPKPAANESEHARVTAALTWLDDAALLGAREFALGEERTFSLNQDAATLTLIHESGVELTLRAQVLASFRPRDRSFRWGWANSSIDPMLLEAINTARERLSVEKLQAFETPAFQATFQDSAGLIALAAQTSGCAGVYRTLGKDGLTVFVGYGAPDKAAIPPTLITHTVTADEERGAQDVVRSYNDQMFRVDVAAARDGHDEELLAKKDAIYARYWHAKDEDYWRPCSFGWPSEHDPSRIKRYITIPRRANGVYVVVQRTPMDKNAFVLETVEGKQRITSIDLNWGRGLLLA
jgi:hypothetical protein